MIVYNEKGNTKKIRIDESKLSLIREGISKRLFHFTSYGKAYSIFKSGRICLSMAMNDDEPLNGISKKKMFYMSATRMRSSSFGFPFGIFLDKNDFVRIELDGDKLSSDGFVGGPYDFFRKDNLNPKSYDISGRHFGLGKHMIEVESEDRIYSRNPVIDNIERYVVRVDIYVHNREQSGTAIAIKNMCEERGIKCNLYDSLKDINMMTDNTANDMIGDSGERRSFMTSENLYNSMIRMVIYNTMYYIMIYLEKTRGELMSENLFYRILTRFGLADFCDYDDFSTSFEPDDIDYVIPTAVKLNTFYYSTRNEASKAMKLFSYTLNDVYKVRSTEDFVKAVKSYA